MKHITVLKTEAIDALDLQSNSVVIDCTFGSGGHAREILSRLGKEGVYVGIDADVTAFAPHQAELESFAATVHLVPDNFRHITAIMLRLGLSRVDAILADFGWRSEQFSEGKKGFSFQDNSTPLMTYGDPATYPFTASDIVNDWDEENIADVIYGYGEERASRRIARAIVAARDQARITSSVQLAEIIESAMGKGGRKSRIHPATKTFQALRIAVNDELKAIETLILDGFTILRPGGRMALITFHSLEDRLVKNLFRTYTRDHVAELVTKKPQVPSREEVLENPRARSAKLRTLIKT